ncbi:MAG: hypothetical protein LBO72_01620 [Helicobacteraceae bacterium]|jgi:hypothetical protein|nr:hypothetical protein [Helicobacteraceae bacterium]
MSVVNKPNDRQALQTAIAVKANKIIACKTIKSSQIHSKGLEMTIANSPITQKDNQ